jgi:hypothetical protein
MAKRFAKTIDPKLMGDGEDNPELQAAQKQMEQMAQEMEQMHKMLQNAQTSMDVRELEIKEFEAKVKAYQAETQRIVATQAGMTPEQIQDIVMGTIHASVDTGDLVSGMPVMPEEPEGLGMEEPEEQGAPEQPEYTEAEQPEQPMPMMEQ